MFPIAILAGGVASRMRPRTDRIPKALLDVAGRPFIAHQLALLRDQDVTDVVLCVGHFGDRRSRTYVGDGRAWGVRVRYSEDGPALLGTGGALRQALPLLGETFFVMYGDSYLAVRLRGRGEGVRGVRPARPDDRFPQRQPPGREQRALRARPHRPVRQDAGHAGYAPHRLRAGRPDGRAARAVPGGHALRSVRVYQDLLAQGQLAGLEIAERFYEIGSPEGLRDTEALLAQPRPRS